MTPQPRLLRPAIAFSCGATSQHDHISARPIPITNWLKPQKFAKARAGEICQDVKMKISRIVDGDSLSWKRRPSCQSAIDSRLHEPVGLEEVCCEESGAFRIGNTRRID